MVGLVAWGTSAMRTQGDDVAEILALIGVRPKWHPESRRVTGIEVIPLEELGRPRIDVTVRISGFFRDAFPHLVVLLDDAVARVAALDEPADQNYVAAHARADAERLAVELGDGPGGARPRGSSAPSPGPTAPGCCSSSTRATGARTATSPRSRGLGRPRLRPRAGRGAAREAMRGASRASRGGQERRLARARHPRLRRLLPVPRRDGGHGTGLPARSPRLLGDSSTLARRRRTLTEETRRVFRASVANPRWIASMIRHGYKGAAELSATVDYLFGYDATTGVAEDWMYEQVAQRYLLDEDVAEFMTRSNPWAARAIAERLIEAAERGLWAAPEASTLADIRDRYLALEGELEEAGA
jgi:cobaltochelatase CobN